MKKFLLPANNKSILLFLFLSVSINLASFAQVKFSAVCTNTKIGKNEHLYLQYVIENAPNIEDIIPPASFKNFSIISGPNQQSSMSIVNGAVSQSVAIGFVLRPYTTGNFTLPPAFAKVNGKNLSSNKLSVQVTNSSSGSSSGVVPLPPFGNIMPDIFPAPALHEYDDYILRKGENLSEKIKKNLFVKVDVSKTSCYIGEPIVATYKLYTRLKSESNLTKSPSFNGFSVSEMEMPGYNNLRTEKYNGREYSVYTLRRVQLFPLQAGNILLDSAEVENHITFIKAEYADAKRGDIFFDMLRDFADATTPAEGIETQKIILRSKPLIIAVKPLPVVGQPKNFKGAVGSFAIHAAVEKNSLTTDEAGNLSISVLGNGNMQMVNSPDIFWPKEIEGFEPKTTENIDRTLVPIRGEKIFNYPFTVSKSGRYIIPPISFSYFDIAAQKYKTLSTDKIVVKVKKGSGLGRSIASHFRKLNNTSESFYNRFFIWGLVLLVIAFIAGLIVWFIKKPGRKIPHVLPENNEQKEANQEAGLQVTKNPLLKAEDMLQENNTNAFYHTLNNCITKYLSVKLNFAEEELSKKKINELLDKHNVSIGTVLMLSSLLENIEINLYAPLSSASQMHEAYEKASEVISLLDKQLA